MMPDTASLWAAAKRFEGILRKDTGALSFAPLADIYRRLGLLEDALEAARKGCELYPDFAAGQMSLAKSAVEFGCKDEAVKALEAVVRVTPENLEAQRLLADLYTAEGKTEAALYCLSVANSLDMEFQESAPSVVFAETVTGEEDIFDADILDLSDELFEDESFDDSTVHFAASPDRPSLGETINRAEPFLLETPPPFFMEEPVAVASPVMASATIAELYVKQGFTDKGADVYRELLSADPLNEAYGKRLAELTQPEKQLSVERQAVQSEGLLDKLQEWLGNIGRVRECRTRNL
jgi:tetratricopeptide (TPR) repeat protein